VQGFFAFNTDADKKGKGEKSLREKGLLGKGKWQRWVSLKINFGFKIMGD
jgi:hypothetical protein